MTYPSDGSTHPAVHIVLALVFVAGLLVAGALGTLAFLAWLAGRWAE